MFSASQTISAGLIASHSSPTIQKLTLQETCCFFSPAASNEKVWKENLNIILELKSSLTSQILIALRSKKNYNYRKGNIICGYRTANDSAISGLIQYTDSPVIGRIHLRLGDWLCLEDLCEAHVLYNRHLLAVIQFAIF